MITIHDDRDHNAILVEPLEELTKEDFAELTKRFNAYVNQNDAIPSLIIHTPSFPGWANFAALTQHLKFIENHHKLIQKIAIVSDSSSLSVFPALADHFVSAKVRHFSENQLKDAKNWVASSEDEGGGFTLINDMPDDVLAIKATGQITSRDYEQTLMPLMEKKLKDHKKLKMLFYAGPDFEGYSAGAMWDDAKLGLMHFTDFSKIAVVTDVGWVRMGIKLFAPFFPAQVHLFSNAELNDAKAWITA